MRINRGLACALAFGFVLLGCFRSAAQDTKGNPREAALKKFLQSYLEKPDAAFEEEGPTRYASVFVDLRNDGGKEAIVYIMGRAWCGSGGCPMLILAREGPSYRVVTETSITQLPIRVLTTKSNGWYDIGVVVAGGGIQPGYEARLSFDGSSYPTNPSVSPAREMKKQVPGKTVIPDNVRGKVLYDSR